MGRQNWRSDAAAFRDGLLQVCLLPESELGLAYVRFGCCGRHRRASGLPDVERDRSEPGKVAAAGWQTADVPRVERCELFRPIDNRLLREHAGRGWLRTDRGVGSSVSCARDGTLRGWRWAECLRPGSCARTVGGTRPPSGNNYGLTLH